MNQFYAHFVGETGPTKIHEMEKKRLTLLLEYYNQKYNRTRYVVKSFQIVCLLQFH